jgi:hypothetical protein
MVDELVNEQNLLPQTVLPLWRKVIQHQTTDMSQQSPAPGSIAAFRADAIEVRHVVTPEQEEESRIIVGQLYLGTLKQKIGDELVFEKLSVK